MSKTIDERVVEMRFDNKQFESNVSTTMSSLDKLKKSLDLSGASKGLEDVSSAAKKVDLSGISSGAEAVRVKFSALEIVAITALSNITNSAINAGKRLVASLSIDQITAGWDKYGQKTASVQTIMNATGKTIDEVNQYLDKLMWFSDETSYGFTDMTAALGQLTSAGGDIDKLIPMITGIANATAYAGKGAGEFSRAIYNLNQSYSAGSLQYMDWKSLELAGIASKELKQTFIDTGIALGKIKEGEVTIANFGQTLSDRWADTEVMEKAFGKFGEMTEKAYEMVQSGEVETASEAYKKLSEEYDTISLTAAKAAQEAKTFSEAIDATKDAVSSGWMKSFELIFGDYEEAKVLWTDLANTLWDIFASGAEARNELLDNWRVLGGRDDLIESFKNVFEGLESIITPIKEAFREIFPPTTAEQLAGFTRGLKELTAKLKISETTSENLKRTFKGLFAILSIAKQIVVALFKAIGSLFGGFGELGGGILGVTACIGDFLVLVERAIKNSNIFGKVFQGIANVIKFVISVIASFFKLITGHFAFPAFDGINKSLATLVEKMSEIGDSAETTKNRVAEAFSAIGSAIKNSSLFKVINAIWNGIKALGSALAKFAGNIFGDFINMLTTMDLGGLLSLINSIIVGGIGVKLIQFISNFNKSVKGFKDIGKSINNVLDSVSDAFNAFQNNLNAKALLKIAGAIAILTASLVVLSFIDHDKLSNALAAITILFAGLISTMAVFVKSNGVTGMGKASSSLIALSAGILLLSFALKKISKLNIDEIGRGLLGVLGLMAIVVGSMKVLSTKDSTSMIKGAMQMIAIAYTIKIFASILKSLAELDIAEMGIGLLGVFGLMATLVAGMKILVAGQGDKVAKPFYKFIMQMITVAKAIQILSNVLMDLAYLDWDELGIGLIGLIGVTTTLVAAMKILAMSNNKVLISSSIALIAIAAAVRIMTPALESMAKLSWEELGKAGATLAALVGALALLALITKLVNPIGMITLGLSLIPIAVGLTVIGGALKIMGTVNWKAIGVLAASLGILAIAMNLMVAALPGAAALIIVSAALMIFAPSLILLGTVNWKAIGVLAASLGILAIAMNLMVAALPGAAALIIVSAALMIFAPALALLGSLSWQTILTGLGVLAGAFIILGVAGKLLSPIIPAILGICGALILLSVGIGSLGIGLLALGAGLSVFAGGLYLFATSLLAVASTLTAALKIIITGLIELIPLAVEKVAEGIGRAIVAIFGVITSGSSAIGEAVKALILMLCDVLVECVPAIIDTALKLLTSVLKSLANFIPQIAESLFDILIGILEGLAKYVPDLVTALFDIVIGVLEGIADNIPALIQAVVDIFVSIFQGAVDALKSIDPDVLLKGLTSLALITGIMVALASLSALIPQAMIGVLGLGVLIAELSLVLAAIGGLAQIPGLSWIISEGGNFLQVVGTVIGQFIGGIAGGIAQGFTGSLPQIANDLSLFMTNLQPFIEGTKLIDASTVDGVMSLVKVILAITGATVLERISSWLTGGNTISTFSNDIVTLGIGLKGFSDSVAGVNPENVAAATEAAKALAEMTNAIPNSGGIISWFAGDNSISKFGDELPILGTGLKGFSDSVAGVIPENIIAASDAAKALAEMTSYIPNSGGVVSWFAGDNSISKFGDELPTLGAGLKGFSDNVTGINPEAITAAANAAKVLAEMTNAIPNSGGVASWFTGDNSISKFSVELALLGRGLKGFSDSTIGIKPEVMTTAANAAKALAEMTSYIPNTGGVVSWFTGDSSISKFANELPKLGTGLRGFSESVSGVNPEIMTAAANAGKTLAEMTNSIPNSGGVVSWFTGEASISKFGADLISLGAGLKGFSDNVLGVNPETMIAAANAGKALAEMTSYIPNSGGVVSWFTGEASLSKFKNDIIMAGEGIKGFSDNTTGVNPETVVAAAEAAKALAEMTSHIPNSGGVVSWFTGESSVSKFAEQLPKLGNGLKGFSDSTSGVNPENMIAAAESAKSLAEMTQHIPKEGGIKAWFTGETNVAKFADKLPTLGKGLKGFSDSVVGVSPTNITSAANAAKSLAEMTETVPRDTKKIIDFGNNLKTFGSSLASYFSNMKNVTEGSISSSTNAINSIKDITSIDSSKITSLTTAINDLVKTIKNLSSVPKNCTSEFSRALSDLGEASAKAFLDEFKSLESDMKKSAEKAINSFINGVNDKRSKAEKAFVKIVEECAEAIEDKSSLFKTAGKQLVIGFADGISANSYKAEAKARAMAKAAALAAEEELDINSPSKVGYGIGNYFGMGFINAIDDYANKSYNAGSNIADSARSGLSDAINRINNFIDSDMDTQPTIRPVLDLSDVRSGVNSIGRIFGNNSSIGVSANVGAISSMMNSRSQNGVNDDVISAIDKLRKDLGNVKGDTYNINGVTYDDGSNIADAVKSIVRAAKIERRV